MSSPMRGVSVGFIFDSDLPAYAQHVAAVPMHNTIQKANSQTMSCDPATLIVSKSRS